MEITLSGEHQFENAALALDVIDVLREKGYEIERVRAVDQFPHTVHVETIVSIQKKNS